MSLQDLVIFLDIRLSFLYIQPVPEQVLIPLFTFHTEASKGYIFSRAILRDALPYIIAGVRTVVSITLIIDSHFEDAYWIG